MRFCLALILSVAALPTFGAVGIYLSSPTSPVLLVGGQSFVVDVSLVETFDQQPQLIAVDYTLTGTPATLTGRDSTDTALPDLISPDAQAFAGHDLGGLVDDLTKPVQPGTWHLGRFTLTVPVATLPGLYSLTFADANYVTAGDFTDHTMNVIGNLPVRVETTNTPEPGLAAALAALLLLRARR